MFKVLAKDVYGFIVYESDVFDTYEDAQRDLDDSFDGFSAGMETFEENGRECVDPFELDWEIVEC